MGCALACDGVESLAAGEATGSLGGCDSGPWTLGSVFGGALDSFGTMRALKRNMVFRRTVISRSGAWRAVRMALARWIGSLTL